jgi:hypothetical protein
VDVLHEVADQAKDFQSTRLTRVIGEDPPVERAGQAACAAIGRKLYLISAPSLS